MTISTALTETFGLQYPIVSAPMALVSGGRLAAAVSNAGGLGLVGGGYGDPDWLREELFLVREEAERPWGVGLITWHATHETVELALTQKPHAFMLAFGDPRPYVPAIKEAGCQLICQVEDVEGARRSRRRAPTSSLRREQKQEGTAPNTLAHCRWYPRWSTRSPRRRFWPLAASPTGGAWQRRSC